MSLLRAMNANVTTTENNMPALQSTMDGCVDLFFKIGSARGKFKGIAPIISRAAAEDLDTTIRILLWARDVRGGAGERQLVRDSITLLFGLNHITRDIGSRILLRLPDLGRWDDVLAFIGTPCEEDALKLIGAALAANDGLCAKWMPREKNNPEVAKKLMQHFGMSPRTYRKMLVELTNVVETQMCDNKWTEIKYDHVPSLASARYQKAFGRHDGDGYSKYIASLEKGEAKINAGAVYPYDVVKSAVRGNARVADQQWLALPNYLGEDYTDTLVMADTSGSMTCPAGGYGSKSGMTCLDVSISLALYLSERNKGLFKDTYITFSDKPSLITLKGTLSQRLKQMPAIHPANTNIEAAFKLVVGSAVKHRVKQSEMPSRILILSDMQFDRGVSRFDHAAQQLFESMYNDAGYKMPQIVYWNLNAQYDNCPVEFDKRGTALISGFSPAIMKGVLKANMDEFTPINVMKAAIMDERYDY
jgi:hypothetical protein